MALRQWTDDALATAIGRAHRRDPVLPATGGPAGNARLTAWTGLALLVLFVVELGTLVDLEPLIGWHIVVGVLLVPPALLKTLSTGWRILRYYTGRAAYRAAGPPPLLLRLLGPLVVLFTLAVLGTGLALVVVGPPAGGGEPLVAGVSLIWLHQASFAAWSVVTGAHTLARLVPALRLVTDRAEEGAVPGEWSRLGALAATLAVAGVLSAVMVGASDGWATYLHARHAHHHERAAIVTPDP